MEFNDWLKDRIPALGGSLGSVSAWFLNINIIHVGEIALYGLIGSLIGEAVKLGFEVIKKKKNGKY